MGGADYAMYIAYKHTNTHTHTYTKIYIFKNKIKDVHNLKTKYIIWKQKPNEENIKSEAYLELCQTSMMEAFL